MISESLRMDIEVWMSKKESNPVYQLARDGRMTHEMVTRYIASVTFMVTRAPGHIARARDRARQLGDHALAAHFDHKLEEEIGHAVWGEADLDSLARSGSSPARTTPTPSTEALDLYVAAIIEEDPALYFAYLAFSEYVTVVLGPELLAMIDERCGIPKSSMTVIANHVEIDREHAEEGFAVINDLVGDPRKLRPLQTALSRVLGYFDGFCHEIAQIGAADGSERHVFAA
jgi:pyrroloquinoline quinone (PQQ) biosynthesis protein C